MPTVSSPVDLLKTLATHYRVRVTTINLHDANVCTSELNWQDALANRTPAPDRFRHQLKLKHGGRSVGVRSNDRFIAIEARGSFGSEEPFSINRQDRVTICRTRLARRVGSTKWRVFTGKGKDVPRVLNQLTVRRAIERLQLGRNESVHVYANGLIAYIMPGSAERVIDVIAATASIANALPSTRAPLPKVPEEFATLRPLLKTWANSDDEERSELLARASRSRLGGLVKAVAPMFPAINAYLDSLGDGPMPESATALGALAECASEAQLLLREKPPTKAARNKRR